MSRIGKLPVTIPPGVEIIINGQEMIVKGIKGELSKKFPSSIEMHQENGSLTLKPRHGGSGTKALWGLCRSLIANMVIGTSEGFSKSLEIIGVGYKAVVNENQLELAVGYSHPVNLIIPKGISITVLKNTMITVNGIDKELVGQTCAEIRKTRPPEPYKGKGIRYLDEVVLRKIGKKK